MCLVIRLGDPYMDRERSADSLRTANITSGGLQKEFISSLKPLALTIKFGKIFEYV